MLIQFIGLGYIGLPTAAVVSQKFNVHGVDLNKKVVQKLNKGESHIYEKGLQSIFEKSVHNGSFIASEKPRSADVHVIVVPTPFKDNFKPDLSYIKQATESLIPLLKKWILGS